MRVIVQARSIGGVAHDEVENVDSRTSCADTSTDGGGQTWCLHGKRKEVYEKKSRPEPWSTRGNTSCKESQAVHGRRWMRRKEGRGKKTGDQGVFILARS